MVRYIADPYRTLKHDLIDSIGITVATCTRDHNDWRPAEHQPSRFLTIASIARMPFAIFIRADTLPVPVRSSTQEEH